MEVTVTAKTVEAAIKLGAEQLGKDVSEVTVTVLEEPKKGFLGMFNADAKVLVSYDEVTPEQLTIDFLNTLITDMGIDARAKIERVEDKPSDRNPNHMEKQISVTIEGERLGILIGRHGDVLDAIQYLANIAAGRVPKNPEKHDYVRVMVDIENYRAKREETLKALARRMADKALTYHKNLTLEPMSSYERRIIHSEIQGIPGVHTYSIGSDRDRRVVVAIGDEERQSPDRNAGV